ncbi:MAG: MarR family transcriptional regulator, partial [Acetobacteraceae bacterium]|nr:MarR family transcriptional regulator [Acetobacteraceae bacterium]
FLTCYLQDGAHTVRGLAADLNVSKPAITRALDRLGELDLARRKVDPMDRRSVLVQRTLKGAAFLRDLRSIMGEAAVANRKTGTAVGTGTEGSRKSASA